MKNNLTTKIRFMKAYQKNKQAQEKKMKLQKVDDYVDEFYSQCAIHERNVDRDIYVSKLVKSLVG